MQNHQEMGPHAHSGSTETDTFLLKEMDINQKELMTEEVETQIEFSRALNTLSKEHMLYHTEKMHRDKYSLYKKPNSKLEKSTIEVDSKLMELKTLFSSICQIKIDKKKILLPSTLELAKTKQDILLKATALMHGIIECLTPVTSQLRRQNAQIRLAKKQNDDYQLLCMYGFQHWIDAIDALCVTDDDDVYPFSAIQLIQAATLLESTDSIPLKSLLADVGFIDISTQELHASKTILAKYLPVIIVSKSGRYVVANLHELVFEPQGSTFADILLLNKNIETESANKDLDTNNNEPVPNQNITYMKPKKRGPIPRHLQFPEIVQATVDFVTQYSFSAQERQRTDVANVSGVNLHHVQEHLLSTIPGLKEKGLSKSTVHHLFTAPRRGTANAKHFYGVVKAKVPKKENTRRSNHKDAHHCNSLVNLVMEFGQKFNASMYSCDDKNKIMVGENTPAIGRHLKIRAFFMQGDSPNYMDHDFPLPNSKVIPSGYMKLQHKGARILKPISRSLHRETSQPRPGSPLQSARSYSCPPAIGRTHTIEVDHDNQRTFSWDHLGRLHHKWPRTGPSFVYNRATKFYSSSMEQHLSDLTDVSPQDGTGVIILSDGGPDWSPKFLRNNLALGNYWKSHNMDYLIQVTYAPGHSAQNPIEHLWAPLTYALVGVYLKACLEGESKPPSEQGLEENEKEAKEANVYDKAIVNLNSYWNDRTFDGFPIKSIHVPCLHTEPGPFPFEKCLNAGIRKLNTELKTEVSEIKFLIDHMDKRTYLIMFKKCSSSTCLHCSKFPRKDSEAMQFLDRYGIFSPTPLFQHEEQNAKHFMSFNECIMMKDMGKTLAKPDECLPSLPDRTAPQPRCSKGCHHVFVSKAAHTQNMLLCHPTKPSDNAKNAPTTHKCTYNECGLIFPTYYQLRHHKSEQNYKLPNKGRKAKK